MKKLLFFALCLMFASAAFAQNQIEAITKAIPFTPRTPMLAKATTNTNCAQDTVDFAIEKATGLAGLGVNNATSAQALAQYFNAPQAITVSGLDFYAYKVDATGGISTNMTVELYLAGADSMPTGTALATVTVPVDTTFGGGALDVLRRNATFTTPVTVSQPYVLVVGNYSANNVGVICNSYNAGDGAGDWLSSADLFGTWTRSYNVVIGAAPFNADVIIEPHVTYDLTSDFNYTPANPCGPTTVSFTDNSSPVLQDPMYNLADFLGLTELSFSYNFGDGSPTAFAIDTNYTYATNPPYTVIQYDTLYGWRTTCVVSDTQTVGSPPLTTSTSSTNATCTGGNGSATITPTGTAPYTYAWSNSATTTTANNLVAGDYFVTVTDANGCTEAQTITVGSTTVNLTASNTTTNSACGGATGSATVTPTNGTSPYTYLWSDGQTTQTAANLAANSYSATITDANGCTGAVSGIVVNNPNSPTSSASITSNFNGEDVSCNGSSDGEATVTASGGTAPYTYNWTGGQTTAIATGLMANVYSVTVTDDASCSSISSITITEPTAVAISAATTTDVACNGGSDGAIDITVAGGTGAYSFSWSNSATTEDLTALVAGAYTGTITDANGCEVVGGPLTINEPTALSGSATQTDVTCNGDADGSATATISGGTTPYTYSWSDGQTTMMASGLAANTYMATITDDNGCTYMPNSVTVSEPTAISAGVTATDASTAGGADGAVDLAPAGGTAPYTFAWDNGATTEDLTGVAAGTYSVTITDANGCSHVASGTVLDGPSSIGMNANTIDVNLFPNPAKNQAVLTLNLTQISDVNVQVVNVTGQVLTSINSADVLNTQFELNMTDWAAGVYFVRITAGKETATMRLIKQ